MLIACEQPSLPLHNTYGYRTMKSPRFAVACLSTTVAIAAVIVIIMQFSENLYSQSLTTMTSEEKMIPSTREQDSQSRQLDHMHNEVEILASIVIPDKIISKSDFDFCSKQENNIVLPRDAFQLLFHSYDNITTRPFSWTTKAMTTHHGINKTCASLDDVSRAIQFGSRRWDDLGLENATSLQKELHQSYFVPDQCDVPAMTSFEMCETLSRFQHVINVGDSLQRHLHQGLFIGLRGDYVSGGIQTSNMGRLASNANATDNSASTLSAERMMVSLRNSKTLISLGYALNKNLFSWLTRIPL